MENLINYLRQYISPLLSPCVLLYRFLLLKRFDADIIFVASPADLNTPQGDLFISDKLQGIIGTAHEKKINSLEVFHLFSKKGKYEQKTNFIRLELVVILLLISNPFRLIADTKLSFKLVSKLGQTTFRQRIRFAYWGYLFAKIKPKLIFGIGMDQILISSAKSQGIKTVEVMHGLFPQGGSPFSFTIKEGDPRPDLFLSWHDDFTQIITELGVEAITIGYQNHLAGSLKLQNLGERPTSFVVTLSWSLKESVDPFGVMSSELYEYLANLDLSRLSFRLHPVTCQSRREILRVTKWIKHEFPGSKISLPYEQSLWETFANCTYHITHESSAFFEASLLGVPTLFLNQSVKLGVHIPVELMNLGLVLFDKDLIGKSFIGKLGSDHRTVFKADFSKDKVINLFSQAGLII